MIPRFRVFDKVENLMIYTYEDVKYDYGTGSFNSRDDILYVTEHYPVSYLSMFFMFLEQMKDTDQLVLMQSTGLCDKNGVEIFEGDIVRGFTNNYTPIYQNGTYMAYNVDNVNAPHVSTQFNVIWRDGCEVVGNIHENLELLEVEA